MSKHVPPTGTTSMMQHDVTLTVRCGGVGWGGVGWDINVLTTTSLILYDVKACSTNWDDLDDAT